MASNSNNNQIAPNYNNSAHQDTDMDPVIASPLNVSLAQDAAAAMDIQSVQGTQGSATSTNQCGTSEAMDVEGGDIGSATNSGNGVSPTWHINGMQGLLQATGNEGTAGQKDEQATSKAKAKAKVQDREEQEHAPVNKGKGREKKMTHGNLNTYAQQYFQLREHNHNKIKQIVQIALSADLGLGFGGKAWPEARKATEGLVKVLQQCSEMSVHHLRTPAEPFKAETEEDLGALYPVDLPDVMTKGEVDMYTGKQEGSGLASLSSLTFFKNNANSLWVMEKNEEQAEKDRATALEKEHQNVKVLQSVRVRRAYLIEEKMRRRKQIKSKRLVIESDEEEDMVGVASTSNVQQGGPSTPPGPPKRTLAEAGHDTETSGRSPVRLRLDISAADMAQTPCSQISHNI